MKWTTVLWLILVIFIEASYAEEDTQSWTWFSLNLKKYEKNPVFLYLDYRRADELSESILYLISPRVNYTPFKNLDMGMNYSYNQIQEPG